MPESKDGNEKRVANDSERSSGWSAKDSSEFRVARKHGTGPRVAPPLVKTSRKPPGNHPKISKKA